MMCKEESDNNQENHERDDYIDKLVDELTPKQAFVIYKKKIEKYIEELKAYVDHIDAENQKKSDMTQQHQKRTLEKKLQQYIDLLSNLNEVDFIHDQIESDE